MDQIDTRMFSVRQLYMTKKMNWCLSYNEMLRKKGKNGITPRGEIQRYIAVHYQLRDFG